MPFNTPSTVDLAPVGLPTMNMSGEIEESNQAWQHANNLAAIGSSLLNSQTIVVNNSSIVVPLPVSFTDLSQQDLNLPGTTPGDNPWGSGGNHGIYIATLLACLTPQQQRNMDLADPSSPDLVTALLAYSLTSDPCSRADGQQGTWFPLSAEEANLFGPSAVQNNAPLVGDGRADHGQSVDFTLKLPVNLPDSANTLQLQLTGLLTDARAPEANEMGTNRGVLLSDAAQCDDQGHCTFPNQQHASASATVRLPLVYVTPAALAQLKVLPYTIIYMPPGNLSSASYSTSVAFGLSMTVGDGTEIDNNVAHDFSGSLGESVSATLFGLGAELSKAQRWDSSTKIGAGQAQTTNLTQAILDQKTLKQTISRATDALPGAYGTYMTESFWYDTFELLVHPQLGIWDFDGKPSVQLLGAVGTFESPDLVSVETWQLAACAAKQKVPDPNNPNNIIGDYSNGFTLSSGDVLNAQECQALRSLDPFYPTGQGRTFNTDPMANHVGGCDYGTDPKGDNKQCTIDDVVSWSQALTNTQQVSYNSTLTDLIGNSESAGLSLGASGNVAGVLKVGFSGNVTLQDGETTTTNSSMKITYSNSTTAMIKQATEVTGIVNDLHCVDSMGNPTPASKGQCAAPAQPMAMTPQPHVEIYQDEIFGGFMFLDRGAPVSNLPPDVRNGGVCIVCGATQPVPPPAGH